jgi:hypothetical protein
VLHARELRLLAVPVWRTWPVYQSCPIAGQTSAIASLDDLRGRSFAFSDPLSNSGYLLARRNTSGPTERTPPAVTSASRSRISGRNGT